MKRANAVVDNKVELYTTQYEEDCSIIPAQFTILPNLERSVLTVNTNLSGRKLPLIKDILQRLYDHSTAEFFIYTNVDIGLQPYFYQFINTMINKGHDAIVINRRRLSSSYQSVEELSLIYADLGESHPGFDCFVFKKSLFPKFILGDICVGVPFIGVALAHNIFSFAENPLFVPDKALTFHLGYKVMTSYNNAFYQHNKSVFFNVVEPQLKPNFSLEKFPYAALPFHKRCIKWLLNPSLFSKNLVQLELKQLSDKLNEWRWRFLQK